MRTRRPGRGGAAGGAPRSAGPPLAGPAATPRQSRRPARVSRHRTWSRRRLLTAGGLVAVGLIAAFLFVRSAGSPSPVPVSGTDFRIAAYQGDEVFGGHESVFSHVTSQGKPVVLNFFAGQCPPCRAEMPGFQRVADEFQGSVIFVGIDIGPYVQLGSHEDARSLLSQLKMRYPAGYAVDSAPLTIYGVQGMPTTVVFDSKGQVVETHTGIFTESQLRQKLSPLVGR